MATTTLLRPRRLRTMERPFGWMPCRLLTAGILCRLGLGAKALYLGLCLAADRDGLSYWGDQRLGAQVGLGLDELRRARDELQEQDLVAFDGRTYQVLSLPNERSRRPQRQMQSSPEHVATVLAALRKKLGGS